MKILRTPLDGVLLVQLELLPDERGHFARSYCEEEFASILPHIAQSAISVNTRKGTVRGMHYQRDPAAEAKLVRCTRGAIYDVAADPASGQWFGVELTPANDTMLFVPEGCAHGFQSLTDDSEVTYMISRRFAPESAAGFRWNDPAFDIAWPLDVTVISERDQSWPDLKR